MRPLIWIAPIVLLAGCARPVEPASVGLARELANYVPGQAESCVSSRPAEGLRVIDARTIAYGSGRTVYVNHLAGPCPALSPYNTIIVDTQGGQYCRGDRVRGLEPGSIIPGPSCNLGSWTPYRMR
ncbi:MAG: hypothetical protein ABI454_01905 [Sphingomicrobium sp.]